MPKSKPHTICKGSLKHFNEQAYCDSSRFVDLVGSEVPKSLMLNQLSLSFSFVPFCFSFKEFKKALKTLDSGKHSGPDHIEPYFFLKMAADFVAEPLADLFNLTVETNDISPVWKSAFALKGGDPQL